MPNRKFWEDRYATNTTGWDIGKISDPLKAYIDQLKSKDIRILIPGAGFGHEVIYLYRNGFENLTVVDIAKDPLQRIADSLPDLPKDRLVCDDFFNLKGSYDLILEQTFFCALDPSMRSDYVCKMAELCLPNAKLVGLLFDFPLESGPPYGGTVDEYRSLFEPFFNIMLMEPCYNSIASRSGRELFIKFLKHPNEQNSQQSA